MTKSVFILLIIIVSCNMENKKEDFLIQPNIGVNEFKLGSSVEDIKSEVLKSYGVDIDVELKKDSIGLISISNEISLSFNRRVLSQILIDSGSGKINHQEINIGDNIEFVKEKLDLVESELEDILFIVDGIDGLYLEFDDDWTLVAIIVFNEDYCKVIS